MELEGYLRFVLALGFVLGLIGALALLARRFGMGYAMAAGKRRTRRLSIVETMPLDNKTRLFLVRRDDTEHLIAVGAAGVTTVEGGIPHTPPAPVPPAPGETA